MLGMPLHLVVEGLLGWMVDPYWYNRQEPILRILQQWGHSKEHNTFGAAAWCISPHASAVLPPKIFQEILFYFMSLGPLAVMLQPILWHLIKTDLLPNYRCRVFSYHSNWLDNNNNNNNNNNNINYYPNKKEIQMDLPISTWTQLPSQTRISLEMAPLDCPRFHWKSILFKIHWHLYHLQNHLLVTLRDQ